MKKILFIAVIILINNFVSFSQGIVRGKITDKTGETLIGVTIVLKSNRSFGVVTDFDGNYSLKIADTTAQTIVVSYVSYQTLEATVHPVHGQVVIKNFVLESASQDMKEVEIVAKAVKAKDYYMEKLKINSSVTMDYVSSETMKKTGDANVVAAVSRVSGVSTNRGFITVRGIGDRYVKTTINGSRIPTLDPFTNNIKLDMFPSSLVDNIIITKTASPDLPGDWAGAYLSVETKDYPEQMSVNVETSFGYNNQTSFKEVVSSQSSPTDWLGYDNGFRNIDHKSYSRAITEPTEYQEMVALGLGDYYKSLGINGNAWNTSFFNLGLIKLGFLENSQLDDPNAIKIATEKYVSSKRPEAFNKINAPASLFGQSLSNNWNTSTRTPLLNFSQSFSIGNQVNLFGKPLGLLAGFRYGSSVQYDRYSTANRIMLDALIDTVYILSSSSQKNNIETNGWSALFNLAYKINSNHSLSLLFMPNLTGVNNVRNGSATSFNEYGDTLIFKTQFYEERKQMIYQFKSEHYFPQPHLKLELNASYTFGNSSAPDFKNLQYLHANSGDFTIGGGNPIQRFYRYLSENLFDSHISAEIPLGNKPGLTRKLKFGGAYQNMDRNSSQYEYSINLTGASKNFNGDISQFLDKANFRLNYGDGGNLNYLEPGRIWDQNSGYSNIGAGFVMLDYTLTSTLRVSGGLRMEKASIYTDVLKYDTLNYTPDDPRRNTITPGTLDKLSYLPSANIIYKLKKSEEDPINLRLNYSQTVARPSIRELSSFYAYDYELRNFVIGNTGLKMAQVNNFDLRLESYFKSGDNISLSLFYKDFKDHIELINAGGYTWQNVDKSYVRGIELEGKLNLTKPLELRANVAFVKSLSSYDQYGIEISDQGKLIKGPFQFNVARTMYGQAPYVINGIAAYKFDSIGLGFTLSYNIQGPKLVIPGFLLVPDVYEHPRHLLDFKATKNLGKYFVLSLTIKDILNSSISRAYRKDGKWLEDYDKFRYGTNYLLGVSYKL